MRIYHRSHAGRPLRAAWTLEEIGHPYELVIVSKEESAHRARHPLGKVPVLEDDAGTVLFESAAICLHLADLFPDAGLIPPLGHERRPLVYQWTVFAPAEIEPRLIQAANRAQEAPEVAAKARNRFDVAAQAVSAALGERDFLVGDSLTVADVMVASALAFTARVGIMQELAPNLQAYLAGMAARPAYQRALAKTDV